jgi:hypothetical protein
MRMLPLTADALANNLLSSTVGSNSMMQSVHISNRSYQGIVTATGEREHN